MPYFQNVSNAEFIGIYAISDRQYNKDYRIRPNRNQPTLMQNYVAGPYNLSTKVDFGIKYSMDAGTTWNQITVTLTSGAARTVDQVVTDLNANTNFTAMFTAFSQNDRIWIRANSNMNTNFRAYIPNIANTASPTTSAEEVLGFNRNAPVVEMPSYFAKYAIGTLAGGIIVQLSQPNENFVITNAGLSTTPKADYELLEGTCGLFTFVKNVVDGSDRVISRIEYAAGAKAGDLAKKTTYTYTAANKNPDRYAEVPYTLTSGDLITPP
jgi:hypothetical protein